VPLSNNILFQNRRLVGWLEFNILFQHKYGYIRDDPKQAEEGDRLTQVHLENSHQGQIITATK